MFKAMKRWWKYFNAKLNSSFEAKADPKVQLEQAITEAQDQHRRLREQAANVIANQKQTEMRLNRKMGELEKLNGNARQAVMMADEASKAGDTAKAARVHSAAEAFANRLIQLEHEIDEPQGAGAPVHPGVRPGQGGRRSRTAAALQKKLAERQKLLCQLDQAKMQEQMNKAMAIAQRDGRRGRARRSTRSRDKIEARYAKAKGMAELHRRVGRGPHARDRAGHR